MFRYSINVARANGWLGFDHLFQKGWYGLRLGPALIVIRRWRVR